MIMSVAIVTAYGVVAIIAIGMFAHLVKDALTTN